MIFKFFIYWLIIQNDNIDENKKIITEENNIKTLDDMIKEFKKISEEFDYFNENHQIEDFLKGKTIINIPAVFCVITALLQMLERAKGTLKYMNEEEDNTTKRKILMISVKLSAFFDFLFSSMVWDKDQIFWSQDRLPEIRKMFENYSYEAPEDIDFHFESTVKWLESFDYLVAVISKGFRKKSLFKRVFRSIKFAIQYKNDKQSFQSQAQFFMTVFKEDIIMQMLKLSDNNLLKSQMKKSLPKTMLDKKFYIPFSQSDIITLENLDDSSMPLMLQEDLDLQWKFSKTGWTETEYVKVRVTHDFDFDTINWSKKKFIDENAEPVEFEVIILQIHGGGFISGSSASSRSRNIKYSEKTGFPIFSVDYRLAPDFRFPDALNDWWQTYCWLINYATKYLKISFDKIILMGDSAGANLCLGVLNLWIQKNCRKPDGLHILYPALTCSHTHFSPSFLLSVDDPILSVTFLGLAIEFYVPKDYKNFRHYLLSPLYTPDEMLKQYPPIRLSISGLDPLRDDSISFCLKLSNAGVDFKWIEYQYLMHAFLGQIDKPTDIEEATKAVERSIMFIKELAQY